MNVSKYAYYIIRLRKKGKVNNLSKGRVKNHFDNNLFGIIYMKLGWVSQSKYEEPVHKPHQGRYWAR